MMYYYSIFYSKIPCFFFQLFSLISIALAKQNAVTLPDLLRIIQSAYNPTPITCTVENIYDVKTWLRDSTSKFQHHSHPHAFRFKLNDNGDVEMTYRPWAKAERKEWLPKEGPFIILRDIPPGKPAVLKPDLKKCPTIKIMKDSVEKLKIRMTTEEREWWEKMIREEEERVKLWDSLNEEDYEEAGNTFDLLGFKYTMPDPDPTDQDDQAYNERDANLLRLIEKKENHQPVSSVLEYKHMLVYNNYFFKFSFLIMMLDTEMLINVTLNTYISLAYIRRLCMLIAAIFLRIN